MELYESRLDKLNLVTRGSMVEKERTVKTEGVGVDVPMTLFGWVHGKLAITAQTPAPLGSMPAERFHVVAASAFAIRRALGATAWTLIAEGFVSRDHDASELGERYASGDQSVQECIWIIQQDIGEPTMLTRAQPYRYGLRSVEWLDPEMEEAPLAAGGAFPSTLQQALNADPT